MSLKPLAAFLLTYLYIYIYIYTLFNLFIRFQFILGWFPFCPTRPTVINQWNYQEKMNRIEASICFSTEILIMPSKVGLETKMCGNRTLQVSVGPSLLRLCSRLNWTGPTGEIWPFVELDHFDRKISMWTEAFHLFLDRNFRVFWHTKSTPPPPAPPEAHVFHHCVLTTKRSSYFRESMKSPEIKRGQVIATWVANVCSFLLARHLMTNAPYPTSCSSWLWWLWLSQTGGKLHHCF